MFDALKLRFVHNIPHALREGIVDCLVDISSKQFVSPADRRRAYCEVSDSQLVLLAQQQDKLAFEILIKRYEKLVKGLLANLAPDFCDLPDLVQEVFIRAWRSIHLLRNAKAFKSWLCQICTHLFYDELRRDWRTMSATSLDQTLYADEDNCATRDLRDIAAGPEEILQRKDTTKIVGDAMSRLPKQFRVAMVLRDIDDYTYAQIADLTESDIGTVKSRISRARLKVRKILQPQFRRNNEMSA